VNNSADNSKGGRKDQISVQNYLEDRKKFFDVEIPFDIYKSLTLYLWYIKLKHTCPLTGAVLHTEAVNPETFQLQFETKEFSGLFQLLYTEDLDLLSVIELEIFWKKNRDFIKCGSHDFLFDIGKIWNFFNQILEISGKQISKL